MKVILYMSDGKEISLNQENAKRIAADFEKANHFSEVKVLKVVNEKGQVSRIINPLQVAHIKITHE